MPEHPLARAAMANPQAKAFRKGCSDAVSSRHVIIKRLSNGVDGATLLVVPKRALERGHTKPKEVRERVLVVKIPIQEANIATFEMETRYYESLQNCEYVPDVVDTSPWRPNYPYMALDWIRGPTLATFLKDYRGKVPACFIWSILADLLRGLMEFANTRPYYLIHRDLHEGNIMLDFDDCHSKDIPTAKIIDFSRSFVLSDPVEAGAYRQSNRCELRYLNSCLGGMAKERRNIDRESGECGRRDAQWMNIRAHLEDPNAYGMTQAKVQTSIIIARDRMRRNPRYERGFALIKEDYAPKKLLPKEAINKAVDRWRQDEARARRRRRHQ